MLDIMTMLHKPCLPVIMRIGACTVICPDFLDTDFAFNSDHFSEVKSMKARLVHTDFFLIRTNNGVALVWINQLLLHVHRTLLFC